MIAIDATTLEANAAMKARRTWLRGTLNVAKRYLLRVAARNLGVLMRVLFGVGTPRRLQGALSALLTLLFSLWQRVFAHQRGPERSVRRFRIADRRVLA